MLTAFHVPYTQDEHRPFQTALPNLVFLTPLHVAAARIRAEFRPVNLWDDRVNRVLTKEGNRRVPIGKLTF